MSRRTDQRRIARCVDCEEVREHHSRGLCQTCYSKHLAAGTVTNFPRVTRPRADVLEDWEELSKEGHTRKQACERMGITLGQLEKALERERRASARRAPEGAVA